MKRLTKRIGEHVYYTKGKYDETIPAECEPHDVRKILQALADYEDTRHTPEECAAAFAELDALKRNPPVQVEAKVLELAMEWSKLKQELDVYRAGDIWKIVCFMIARNNIIESVPKERVDVMALMTIKSMPDMLQMEECRKLLAAAEAALKEQEGQK